MKEKVFPVKIGLEIHGYLNTTEKLFCMCRTGYNGDKEYEVNNRICPICTGQPGSKPMAVNKEAVRRVVEIATIFGSRINTSGLIWQRKHYDWADLPKGYQTTLSGAYATTNAVGGRFKGISIIEIHLEEDPAQWNPETGRINYNRSGLPLVEIVTEPEFSNSKQVVEWLRSLILALGYVSAVRKNAGIKVDVNISTYGERVEIKNLNSLEKIRKAINYEIIRQVEAHDVGDIQERESLAFDEKLGKTVRMRLKEDAADYRFIPDPDLPEVIISKDMIADVKISLPEMPDIKLNKLLKKYNVNKEDANILIKNLELVEMFEALVESGVDVIKGVPWITVELLRVLNYNKMTLDDVDVDIKPEHLAELIMAVLSGDITKLKGKQLLNDMIPKSFSLKKHRGEIFSIDASGVENLCKQVVLENFKAVDEYRDGKDASLNYLIGQVMRLSEQRADFKIAGEYLKKIIGRD